MQLHAEKKALAVLLAHGEAKLSISINFNACIDCHEFFKASSQMLGHRILLHQPKITHTFTDGHCSCNDRWRWEARLTPAKQAAGTMDEEQELDAAEAKKRRNAAKHAAATATEGKWQLHVAEDKKDRKVAKLIAILRISLA